ncbi:asparagine synthase-related protein [Nonomuraea sp. NPDC003560]|uniref:asparagine synthase-related protein n=1 Tax=Nonomuraea sp. NPDC003560 TaxID=3364341 RepID=UPI00369FF373
MPGRWLVILADCRSASGLARRLRARACHVVAHASGRPWLLGCWADDQAALWVRGCARIAVLGAGADDLAGHALTGARDVADVERLVNGRAGSFYVLASLDGQVYARGDRSGARRLYRTTISAQNATRDATQDEVVTVLADQARTLAWLSDADVEPAALAARLAGAALPHPLDEMPMWRGVDLVPPGHAAHLDRDGTCRLRPGPAAQLPVGRLPLAESAVLLRQALQRAVTVRVRAGRQWGADLSGGMDSTSLCFLAAQAGAQLTALTLHWSGARNEDARYAELAAAHLPGLTHLTFPSARLPALFTGLAQARDAGDSPMLLRDRARQDHLMAVLAERGIGRRLSGYGGDHLVIPPVAYLRSLARHRPLTALRHTVVHQMRHRWTTPQTVHLVLLPAPSYSSWLRGQADRLHTQHLTRAVQAAGPAPQPWGVPVTLPAWATSKAVDLLAAALQEAADTAEPLAAGPAEHAWRRQARQGAHSGSRMQRLQPLQVPFCDDEVLDACLSVRPHEAGEPWSYKPLLAAAMRDLVPEQLLARTTKDGCIEDWYAGLKTHQRELAAWADDSHLVAAGLADPGALRRLLLSPGLTREGCGAVEATLGAEAWLRDLAAHPEPAYLTRHHHHKEPRATAPLAP